MRTAIRPTPLVLCWVLAACGPGPSDTATPDDTAPDETDTVETDTDTDLVQTGPQVTLSGVQPCANPAARSEAPFDHLSLTGSPADLPYFGGGGVAAADLTGDGRIDIVTVAQSVVFLHPQDEDGGFGRDVLLTRALSGRDAFFGASVADYDGDLDLDLFLTAYHSANVLLRNDGGGRFTDVTAQAGLAGPADHYSASSAWADMDDDGDLDVVVGGHGFVDTNDVNAIANLDDGSPTLLYRNRGDGTFADATELIDPSLQGHYTFNAAWQDLDGDGLLDLYLANDFAETSFPSQMLRNDGRRFLTEGAALSLFSRITGMGLGLGDLDEDGVVDVLLPGWTELGVLVSEAGQWFEASAATGIEPDLDGDQGIAWGFEMLDVDNDGDMDVAGSFGDVDFGLALANSPGQVLEHQPDALYLQGEGMVFRDVGAAWGVGHTDDTRGLTVADVNADGWPDLVRASPSYPTRVDLSRCGTEGWLAIQLRQPGKNAFAIGATVKVHAGARTWTRWVRAGGTGYGSGSEPTVHVGLGDLDRVDRLEILWPDGSVDEVEGVEARQVVTVHRALATP